MRARQAREWCDNNEECAAFTFASPDDKPSKPVTVWFKRISYVDRNGRWAPLPSSSLPSSCLVIVSWSHIRCPHGLARGPKMREHLSNLRCATLRHACLNVPHVPEDIVAAPT